MANKNGADAIVEEYLRIDKKIFSRAENLLTVLLFLGFLFGFLVLFILTPDREYSKTENKELQTVPKFSFSELFEGTYTDNTVDYIKDQFPAKDLFVELNAAYSIVMGQLGNNGVILGKDGYLLTEENHASSQGIEQLHRYENLIDSLSLNIPTVVAVAGKGSQVLTDKLPVIFSTDASEHNRLLVKNTFEDKDYLFLDLAEILSDRRSEEIYYRTDHHWTSLGAFYGSAAILQSLNKPTGKLEDYFVETATDNFRGTVFNRSGMFWKKGEKIQFFRYEGDDRYTVSFCSSSGEVLEVSNSLYNRSCLTQDYHGTAYDSFVAPVSTPVVRIEKEGQERETLLVLKDSFAHSALPFLAREYNIVTVDIRSNAGYAAKLIEEGSVDALLVLVNSDTLLG